MPEDSVFNQITRQYYQLTASEKKLANFVVANGQQTQNLSISRLAAACGVAEATIFRFCRRMGYRGYSDFRLALAASSVPLPDAPPLSGDVARDGDMAELCARLAGEEFAAIRETEDLISPARIRAAVEILTSAKTVLCMGQGGSMLLAEEAANLFATVYPGFFPVRDSHMQVITAAGLTEEDAVLFISYSGSTRELLDVLRVARERKTRTVLMTRYPGSPGAELADVVLQCGSTEEPLRFGSVTSRIAQLYLLDVLFSEMCSRDEARCRRQRALLSDVLAEKHV